MRDMSDKNIFPPHAKRVYKGKIYEIWEWEQEMFDGSIETFEGMRRPDTVDILASVGDSVLVEDQEQPGRESFICTPGGRVDEGEEPLTAAKRELLEETGYASDDWRLWRVREPSGKVDWTIYLFVACDCKKAAEPHLDAGERITTRLASFDELLLLSDEPRFRGKEMVEELLRLRLHPELKDEVRTLLFGN